MKEQQATNRGILSRLFLPFFALLLVILPALIFTAPEAKAVGTPAGTKIGNQATATYEDSAGNSFLSTSPLVETTVLPVRGLTITPNGADQTTTNVQNATPGSFVYYSYTLTNTGNATDSFNINTANGTTTFTPANVKAYYDVNGNGIIDVGDTLLSSAGSAVAPLASIAADASVKLIVQYQVPVGASSGQFANVNITGESVGDNTKTDTDNFNKTTVTNNAVVTIVKSPNVVTADPGQDITYTLNVSNTGNSDASAIEITDNIPANTQFIVGSFSSALTTVGIKYYDALNGGGNEIVAPLAGVNSSIKSFVVTQTAGNLPPSNTRLISYQVRINSTTAGGSTVENSVDFDYFNGQDPVLDNKSNIAQTVVNKKSAALISFSGSPFTGTSTNGSDQTGTTNAPTDETTTSSNVPANTFVYYKNVVTNNGNSNDVFNISVSGSTLPAGSAVSFFQLTNSSNGAGNTSPLLDTNGDGIPDTGSLNPGSSVTIVARIFVPADATTGGTATIIALSTNGGTAISSNNGEKLDDTTMNIISGIQSPGTDIRNIIDGSPSDTAVTYETSANGTTVSFPLNLLNTGGSFDTFNLTFSGNPAGSTVLFYPIANSTVLASAANKGDTSVSLVSSAGLAIGDQIVINGQTLIIASISGNNIGFAGGQSLAFNANSGISAVEPSTTPITSTSSLAPNASQNVIAVVTIPVGTAPNPGDNITFTSTSNNNGTVTDSITDTIIISEFRTFTLAVNRSGSAPSPGVLFYEHTITNIGNLAQTFNLSFTGTPNGGFSYQTLNMSGVPVSTSPSVPVGGTYTFQVRVDIQAGVASGTVHNYNIRATDSTNVNNYRENTDTTSVVAGFVALNKSVANITNPGLTNEAYPGDILEYTVTYTNIGNQDALKVKISDLIPANTTYEPGTLVIDGISKTDGTGDDQAFFSSAAPAGTTFHVGSGATASVGGTVGPGQSGTVKFRVKVNDGLVPIP